MSFQKLIEDLTELQLAKSETINGGDEEGEENEGEVINKSLKVILEDGEEVEAIDGSKLVKSLIERHDEQIARIDSHEESLTKALGSVVDLLKSQSEQIKTLNAQVSALSGAGRGRKSVVSVSEKPALGELTKSEPAGMDRGEFMAKALDAQKLGRITAVEVAALETKMNKGLQIEESMVKRVIGA